MRVLFLVCALLISIATIVYHTLVSQPQNIEQGLIFFGPATICLVGAMVLLFTDKEDSRPYRASETPRK